MSRFSWADDPNKWVIRLISPGCWAVLPPIPSFWGRTSSHASFEQARADFIRQTDHMEVPPAGGVW